MVSHASDPSTQEAEGGGSLFEFKVSLGDIVQDQLLHSSRSGLCRPCLKNKKCAGGRCNCGGSFGAPH